MSHGVTIPRDILDRLLKTSEDQATATAQLVEINRRTDERLAAIHEKVIEASTLLKGGEPAREAAVEEVNRHTSSRVKQATDRLVWWLIGVGVYLGITNLFQGSGTRWLETIRAIAR